MSMSLNLASPTHIAFSSENLRAFDDLFNFRDDVEQLALTLKRRTKNNRDKIILAKHSSRPVSPLPFREVTPVEGGWYTLPHKDSTISRVPYRTFYESGVGSSVNEDDGVDSEEDKSKHVPDAYGFFRN